MFTLLPERSCTGSKKLHKTTDEETTTEPMLHYYCYCSVVFFVHLAFTPFRISDPGSHSRHSPSPRYGACLHYFYRAKSLACIGVYIYSYLVDWRRIVRTHTLLLIGAFYVDFCNVRKSPLGGLEFAKSTLITRYQVPQVRLTRLTRTVDHRGVA